jgi:hypothetical protein
MAKSDGIVIAVIAIAIALMWNSNSKPIPGPEPIPVPSPNKLIDSAIHELRVGYANSFREAGNLVKRLDIKTDEQLQKMLSESTKLAREIAFTPVDAAIERDLPRDENGFLQPGAAEYLSRLADGFDK